MTAKPFTDEEIEAEIGYLSLELRERRCSSMLRQLLSRCQTAEKQRSEADAALTLLWAFRHDPFLVVELEKHATIDQYEQWEAEAIARHRARRTGKDEV